MTVTGEAGVLTDEQLRDQVVTWLRENLPPEWVQAVESGDAEALRATRGLVEYHDWCARLGEAGWATPTWPREYGGAGLDPSQARIVNDELSRYQVPRSFNIIGIGMGGPTVLQWGTPEQAKRWLPPMAQHREIWCQLFS
jgi:alkylation response protein AidB-like acyl-CoA dehydrogenase